MLDAHLSGRVIGRHLRGAGHDVLAINERSDLEGIDDEAVLALAAAGGRVLVTQDVSDCPEILRRWAEAGWQHAGCVIVVGFRLPDFGSLIRAVEAELIAEPAQEHWRDRCVFAGRG